MGVSLSLLLLCELLKSYGPTLYEGNDNPRQYSCLENPMDTGAWWATVHGVTRVGHNVVTKPPPHFLSLVLTQHSLKIL